MAGPMLARRFARQAISVAALGVAIALATPTESFAGSTQPPLFGSRELHSNNLAMFPKWQDALRRFAIERKGCVTIECRNDGWLGIVADLRGKDAMSQLRGINREMNKRRYVPDNVNWHAPDYWATPFQFMQQNGDCEDFAISKYLALRELGFTPDEMRIVVLDDLQQRIAHAVLVVYRDGTAYVLDNQISGVVPAGSIRHYKPVYSINEAGWWLHQTAETAEIDQKPAASPSAGSDRS